MVVGNGPLSVDSGISGMEPVLPALIQLEPCTKGKLRDRWHGTCIPHSEFRTNNKCIDSGISGMEPETGF